MSIGKVRTVFTQHRGPIIGIAVGSIAAILGSLYMQEKMRTHKVKTFLK